jgi:hypothetical protein
MSEQVFKSPGFFEREIEIQSKPPKKEPNSSPVGIIGSAEKGPAFVPITLNSINDYTQIFGNIHRDKIAGHAVAEFFNSKTAQGEGSIQFIRTLGAEDDTAGFKLTESSSKGGVQFLCADHNQSADDQYINGMFAFNSDIDNTTVNTNIKLVRAVFFLHKNCELTLTVTDGKATDAGEFTIKLTTTDISISQRSVTASLDPAANNYIAKVMNTDPYSFEEYGYLLYLHFPIDIDLLNNIKSGGLPISIVRPNGANNKLAYGDFQTSFKTPRTSKFISQPFGSKEYDLFHFEAIDDGSYAAGKYKISISNLRASTDVNYKFGTFNVELRDLNDTDEDANVLESYANCSLDPSSPNYIGKLIGDHKTYYNFNATSDERRLYTDGENPNQSSRIRIVMSDDVKNGEIPEESLPFGFRGLPSLKTKETDLLTTPGYIIPPLPYRFKLTTGELIKGTEHTTYIGRKTSSQIVSTSLYWGLMNFNIDKKETANNRATSGEKINKIVENYTKLMAVNSDVLNAVDSKEADDFNNHKFSLARVAFPFPYTTTAVENLNNSVIKAFEEVVYIRNADYFKANYEINQTNLGSRITLATVLSENKEKFNKYSVMAKFTAPMFGGFDGLNIFDKDSMNMNDRSSSTEDFTEEGGVAGKAGELGYSSGLSDTSVSPYMQGTNDTNNIISSYLTATDIMLEPATANVHVVVVPGIRDRIITSYVASKVETYGKAIYLMDIPSYDRSGIRLYDDVSDAGKKPDVSMTISKLSSRNFDNSYVATYFPDVLFDDVSDPVAGVAKRVIKCPSSIVALGALAKSEGTRAIQPWFAPAGFANGANQRVKGVTVRLRADDRDDLYEARINPIATFPSNQYVIFGQKTLQVANTALTRVNVRRLMIAIKRGVERSAQALLFQQNTAATRDSFVAFVNAFLSNIQTNSGIENYRVIVTPDPEDGNVLNGRIIIVPTRVVEFIAMDFIVTNSGVSFT